MIPLAAPTSADGAFIAVSDAEFGVARDPFGEVCDEVGPKLVRYKQGERFSSRWVVQ